MKTVYIVMIAIALLLVIISSCIHISDLVVFPNQFTKTDSYRLDTLFTGKVADSLWDTMTITHDNILLNGLLIKCDSTRAIEFNKYIVIFSDGNASNLNSTAKAGRAFHRAGVNFIGFEYRGYGMSFGKVEPSEKTFCEDGDAVYSYVRTVLGFEEKNILIASFSIGSIAAIENASTHNPAGLFLLAPVSSAEYVGDRLTGGMGLPSSWVLDSKLGNIEKIAAVKAPKWFVHGKKDNLIPYPSSEQLFARASEPKKLVFNNDGHNELLWNDAFWVPVFEEFVKKEVDLIHPLKTE